MLKKVSLIILLFLFLSILLSGCYDAMEIDDEAYALVVGIDKGVNNKVMLTILYPAYRSSAGSEEGSKNGMGGQKGANTLSGSNIDTIEASTILEGIDMYGMAITHRVSLMHTKMILFSEDFAKEGIGNYLAPITRFRETRRTMHVAVVKGKAKDFIKENMTNIGESLVKAIELITTQSKNTAFFPEARFNEFYRCILSPYESAIAIYGGVNDFGKLPDSTLNNSSPLLIDNGYLPGEIPREGGSKREFAGTAVFNGDKMVGKLDSVETRYYLLMMGKYRRGVMTINDKEKPGSAIAIDIRMGRSPQVSSRFENGKPVIDVKLKIEGDIQSIQSRIFYEKLTMLSDLNNQIKVNLQNGIQKLIEKTQKEFKTDIFGFGHKVVDHFSTIQEWQKYNWLSHYPEAEVNVDIEVNVRRTGLMIYSAPIIDTSNATGGKESK